MSKVRNSDIRSELRPSAQLLKLTYTAASESAFEKFDRQCIKKYRGRWKSRNTVAEEKAIVTNEETALLFLLDRRTWPMHEVYVSEPDTVYYAYESETGVEKDASRRTFREGGAYLVVFDSFEDQMAEIYGEDTHKRMEKLFENLNVLFDGDDGTIYTLEKEN